MEKIFVEFPKLEDQVIDLIQNLIPIVHNEPDLVIEKLTELIDVIQDYRMQLHHGRLRSLDYASILLEYVPVFVCPLVIKSGNEIHNGSGCLIELDERFIITNYHVVKFWFDKKKEGESPQLVIENEIFPLSDLLIDYNQTLDLATIKIPDHKMDRLISAGKQFFRPKYTWPASDVVTGDLVTAVGWPGVFREDSKRSSTFFVATIHDEVMDTSDRRFIIQFDRGNWLKVLGEKEIIDLTSVGGFSGGPVFLFSDGVLKLVGIVFEDCSSFIDGVQCVNTSFINRDGTIKRI